MGNLMDKIKICIVGLGWTGSNHYAGYAAIPEKAQVVACVARSPEAQAKAKQWGIPKIYKTFDDALQDSEIDALVSARRIMTMHQCYWPRCKQANM